MQDTLQQDFVTTSTNDTRLQTSIERGDSDVVKSPVVEALRTYFASREVEVA